MKKRKIEKKQYVVIGLGRFGTSIAKQLEANGCMVLAVDRDERRVNNVAEFVTRAMCLDITDEEAILELGLSNFDGAVVSIGHNLDAAIFAVMSAKEQGIPKVIAKAYDETQGKILTKVGADEIVYPERARGYHLAKILAFGRLLDSVELTADYSIAEIPLLREWSGKNLIELKLREKYHVNVIAVKRGSDLEITPPADKPFLDGDVLVILGKNDVLNRLSM